ncbi:hypothetical protein N752_05095 [Desulforamulus aquiferis]|nr:hypothetical protein [Desulforamulus aquiferis]RYD06269.1 hypothetical protein N752_05095 [Desulforamulus aquiferis]
MLGRGPIDGLVNLVADNFGDIFSYLLNDEAFNAVNERLYSMLEKSKEPVTLVAYSLVQWFLTVHYNKILNYQKE